MQPQGPPGRPKDRAESAQGPSGTLPSTHGDALGTPKAAYEPSKDTLKPAEIAPQCQGRHTELPNTTPEAPKLQNTMKINEILHFS